MTKASLLTSVEKERLTDRNLDPKVRKRNNMLIKNKLKSWLRDADDILFILNQLPQKKLKKELTDECAYTLLEIVSKILNLLDFGKIVENEGDIQVIVPSSEFKNPKVCNPATLVDFERIFRLQPFVYMLNCLVEGADENTTFKQYKYKRTLQEKIKRFDKAIEINVSNSNAWLHKGEALLYLGQNEEAIKCFDEVIGINKSEGTAWSGKGDALGELGRYEEGIKCYDNAINLNQESREILLRKGIALLQLDRDKEAIQAFSETIERDPNWWMPWHYKGITLANMGKYNEAVKCLDESIKRNPEDNLGKRYRTDALRIIGHDADLEEGALAFAALFGNNEI